MAKVRKTDNGMLTFRCPACECVHMIAIDSPLHNGAIWKWNGMFDSPTISPSIRVSTGKFVDPNFVDEYPGESVQCHSYINNGMIEFDKDSSHSLAGHKMMLADF